MLSGSICITGGSGFLGRAILRRASLEKWPARFTILSRDPMKQAALRRQFPDLVLSLQLGDVRDYASVERVIAGHDTVLHLAALKHIPQAEWDVSECLAVNVDGTRNVARAAVRMGVRKVVGISTDKAARAVNTYGLTKALLERIFQEAARQTAVTEFALARYGNVVGSTGSVIPIWDAQAARGEPLTVTNPGITRFWIDANSAVDIVLAASTLSKGLIYIPRMPAMSVGKMARALYPDAEVTIIGMRPGEKVHEDLLQEQESYWAESFDGHYLLHSMVEPPVRAEPLKAYASDKPSGWITPEQFRAMVALGRTI